MGVPSEAQLAEARLIAMRVAGRYFHPDSGEPEDVAQSVLITFLQQDVDNLDDWRAWVNRTARNRAVDHGRRRRWADGRELDASAPPKHLREIGPSGAAIWPRVWAELTKTLTGTEREMLLASLDGASNAEIAEDFGYASANSAGVTLSRIRAKVRAAFTDREQVLGLLGIQRVY